jgi:hypothetical protein
MTASKNRNQEITLKKNLVFGSKNNATSELKPLKRKDEM